MLADKEYVRKVFDEYASHYDSDNPKVALKIYHTYRVSDISEEIAISLKLSEEDVRLAWLIGMLHDVGRFEQLRRYNTFFDARSVMHAKLACEILFDEGRIRDYIKDDSQDDIIYKAIFYHSDYRLPNDLDERTLMFCNIIRDADKIDILRVQIDTPIEEIYDVTTYDLKNSTVSPEVMSSFRERHAIERCLKKTAVDNIVGHVSLTFELVYPKSREIVSDQGYLNMLLDFKSDNLKTMEQFEEIKQIIRDFF